MQFLKDTIESGVSVNPTSLKDVSAVNIALIGKDQLLHDFQPKSQETNHHAGLMFNESR